MEPVKWILWTLADETLIYTYDSKFGKCLAQATFCPPCKRAAKQTNCTRVWNTLVSEKLKVKNNRTISFAPIDSPFDDVHARVGQRDASYIPHTKKGNITTLSTNINWEKEEVARTESQIQSTLWQQPYSTILKYEGDFHDVRRLLANEIVLYAVLSVFCWAPLFLRPFVGQRRWLELIE